MAADYIVTLRGRRGDGRNSFVVFDLANPAAALDRVNRILRTGTTDAIVDARTDPTNQFAGDVIELTGDSSQDFFCDRAAFNGDLDRGGSPIGW